jgi:hypothetical protein
MLFFRTPAGRVTVIATSMSIEVSASDEANFESDSQKLECRRKLEVVLKKNRDILLIDVVMASVQSENDASIIFNWMNIESFVQQVISDPPPPSIPCPFILPVPLAVETLKTALINYLRAPSVMTQPIGTSVLPGTQGQFSVALTGAVGLNFDPWFIAVAGSAAGLVPIAEVLCMSESCVATAISPFVKAAGARLWT